MEIILSKQETIVIKWALELFEQEVRRMTYKKEIEQDTLIAINNIKAKLNNGEVNEVTL